MKRKLVSLICILALLSSCLVVFALPASAATPAQPTTLPDGKAYDFTYDWLNWTTYGNDGNATLDNGFYQIKTAYKQSWSDTNLPNTEATAWRGASGIMVYVDAATNSCTKTDFMLELLSDIGRPKNATPEYGYTQLNTKPITGKSTSYLWDGSKWTPVTADPSVNGGRVTLSATAGVSGWVYIPWGSIWYHGGSNSTQPATVDNAYGLNFFEFMDQCEKGRVIKASIQSSQVGLRFSDLYLVFDEPDEMPENYTSAPLFGTLTKSTLEGSAQSTVSGTSITVSGMTGNTGTGSGSRAWMNGLSVKKLEGASGLRFYVDSSKLGTAKLQLRVRLMSDSLYSQASQTFANNSGGNLNYKGSYPQYTCASYSSVAYYYDAEGNAQKLHVQSNVHGTADGDLFEALPAGYVGYIYIPFDSFWMSGTSYSNRNATVSFARASKNHVLTQINVCHAISGTPAEEAVTYKDFEVIYGDTAVNSVSLTLTNNLNVNFFASVQDDATAPSMQFLVGTRDTTVEGVKVSDGFYSFTCADIIPQKIGDEITGILTAKVGAYTVTQTLHYSVKQYCENLLASDADAKAKKLVVDLLYYGAAAQAYADYKTNALVTAGLSDDDKALRSADTTSAITKNVTKSGTASTDYAWGSANLLLDSTLTFKFTFTASSTENLVAEVKIGDRAVSFDTFETASGTFTLLFDNIGAVDLDTDITLTLKKNDAVVGEVVTLSAAAYLKLIAADNPTGSLHDLARSIYAYGASAVAFAG